MNTEELIRMAREAGFIINDDNPATWSLERFAAFVAAAEREACAKAAENFLTSGRSPLGRSVATAVRARGETK